MKRLLISALMALSFMLTIVLAVVAFVGLFWCIGNYPIYTVSVAIFAVFAYFWWDAYKYLD